MADQEAEALKSSIESLSKTLNTKKEKLSELNSQRESFLEKLKAAKQRVSLYVSILNKMRTENVVPLEDWRKTREFLASNRHLVVEAKNQIGTIQATEKGLREGVEVLQASLRAMQSRIENGFGRIYEFKRC